MGAIRTGVCESGSEPISGISSHHGNCSQKWVENRDVGIFNKRLLVVATCAVAGLLNLDPMFGQIPKPTIAAERVMLGLPAGAVLVEIQPLPPNAHADRMLALWMLNPDKLRVPKARAILAPNAPEETTSLDQLAFRWSIRHPGKSSIRCLLRSGRSPSPAAGKKSTRRTASTFRT